MAVFAALDSTVGVKLQSICCRILFAIGCRTAGFSLLSPTAGIFAVESDAYADAENKGALFLLSPDDPVCQPNMSHDPLVVSLTPLNCFRAKLQIHTRSSETFAERAQPQDESCGREGNCQGQAESEGEVQECTQHCDRASLSVPASVAPSAGFSRGSECGCYQLSTARARSRLLGDVSEFWEQVPPENLCRASVCPASPEPGVMDLGPDTPAVAEMGKSAHAQAFPLRRVRSRSTSFRLLERYCVRGIDESWIKKGAAVWFLVFTLTATCVALYGARGSRDLPQICKYLKPLQQTLSFRNCLVLDEFCGDCESACSGPRGCA